MHVTLAAAQVLRGVIDQGLSLDKSLENMERTFDGNVSELKELSFGGCRYYILINGILEKLLKKPLKEKDRIVHFLLVGAIYQIEYMRKPDHAVVNQSVKALEKTRQAWAKNLANGVLRNFIRNNSEIIGSLDKEHVRDAFPRHLHQQITTDWPEYAQTIFLAMNQKPPLTLRINQKATSRDQYEQKLQDQGIEYELTPASELGVILIRPVSVENIPGFAQGEVSVQDESAQLITEIIDLAKGQRVLDGCAAPGGKTCLMLESEPDLETMVALDLPKRTKGIEQNLARLNLDAQVVSANITETQNWWDGSQFDRILLDVPCSGSGVIRRHPDIKHRRQPADIDKFAHQQASILNAVWPLLKTGGRLLYVTCSIFTPENDAVIDKFMKANEGFELQFLNEKLGLQTSFGRQRLPGVHSGDGFYYCGLNKVQS